MGEVIVDALGASGAVNDVADLFELTASKLMAVERLGEANAAKILEGIERAKTLPLGRIIAALGIKGTGRSMSRRLAIHFGSMAALQAASIDELAGVDGIGPVKARRSSTSWRHWRRSSIASRPSALTSAALVVSRATSQADLAMRQSGRSLVWRSASPGR